MISPAPMRDTSSSFLLPDLTCQCLTLTEIELATNNFDEALVIGRGGFGKVYKSLTKFGSVNEVAVKRLLSTSSQGAGEFEAEVKLLSKLRHGNLVPLIGYCCEGGEMVLAYEFMPNGTLDDHLHRGVTGLSWLQLLKICIGAARGLDYLHTGTSTQHGVIHRDVKTSNILLDVNFSARICYFGLAKVGIVNHLGTYHVSTLVKGTFGYMDPCYFYSGKLTRKSDVYAFGVVLFEVLSGKQAVDPTLDEDQWSLAVWAQDHFRKGRLNEIIDRRLMGQISKRCLKGFTSLAVCCLHNQPKRRPLMAEIVVKLESILSRERETFGSGVRDGRFINKVRFLFIGKADLMRAHAEGNKAHLMPTHEEGDQSDLTPAYAEGMTTYLMPAHVEGSKANLMPAHAEENRPDLMSALATGSKSEISSQYIQISNSRSVRIFTYAELLSATNNFSDKESSTYSLETIYKGWIDELTYAPTKSGVGLAMYVRKKYIGTSKLDFKAEEFNHPNLVRLLGYYLNDQELSCVYELNPSLDNLLYGEQGKTSLSWAARLKIAVGAAQGLSFLHKKGRPAYDQFKTTCILVDADYNARLQEFEVDNSFVALGSYPFEMDAHYAAPEWFRYQADVILESIDVGHHCEGGFGVQREIYSFGVVLLEILTGMKVFDRNRPEGRQNLVKWATPLLEDEANMGMILDTNLQDNTHIPKGAFILAQLVSNCLQPTQDERPSMEKILQAGASFCRRSLSFGLRLTGLIIFFHQIEAAIRSGLPLIFRVWATSLLAHEENLGMILDPQLQNNNHPPKGTFMLAQLVSNCLQPQEDDRPSMEKILQVLGECYQNSWTLKRQRRST